MMHDLDRTQLEGGFDDEYGPEEEFEAVLDDEAYDEEAEWGDEASPGGIPGSPFDDSEEMELAAELVEVAATGDDAELEMFLGRLVRRAARGVRRAGRVVRRVVRSPIGRAIRQGVRQVARRALPVVGGALGGPVGAAVAGRAGQVLGLELEGLSPEDQEFEAARRIVRLAGEATSMAAAVPDSVDDQEAAETALRMATRKHAPGLAQGGRRRRGSGSGAQSGRWVRRGSEIVLLGL